MFYPPTTFTRLKRMIVALLLLGITPSAFAATLINGGFEAGNFSGWTSFSGNVSVEQFVPANPCCQPSSGTYFANFNSADAAPNGTLSQSFSTIIGQEYQLGFYFGKGGPGPGTASLGVSLTGAGTLVNTTVSDSVGGEPGAYAQFIYSFIADAATSTLTFTDTSSGTSSFDALLDNVTVSQVPEPSTIGAILLSTLVLPAAYRRRRRMITAGCGKGGQAGEA